MAEPNSNSPENTEENTNGKTDDIKPVQPSPSHPNAPVTEIKADVDLTKKPASVKENINLLDDDALDKDVTKNTEGDNKKKEEEEKKKSNINDFRQQTSQSTGPETTISPTTAQRQAESAVKILDIIIRTGLKAWSGQADNVGLETTESDKKVLADELALVFIEHNVVMNGIFRALMTGTAIYSGPVMNAQASKKKIDEFRAKQKEEELKNVKIKPEFNPATGKHIKKKGGQYKA